ncbi:hypothetical protein FKM82_015529 [Ascaphus truei]
MVFGTLTKYYCLFIHSSTTITSPKKTASYYCMCKQLEEVFLWSFRNTFSPVLQNTAVFFSCLTLMCLCKASLLFVLQSV